MGHRLAIAKLSLESKRHAAHTDLAISPHPFLVRCRSVPITPIRFSFDAARCRSIPLDAVRSLCRSIPLDLPPSGNSAIPLVGLYYGGKGEPAIMDIMTYASLGAILGWAAEANERPKVPEVEFTPLDPVALGQILMKR